MFFGSLDRSLTRFFSQLWLAGLAAKDANPKLVVIGYLPVFAFSLLDGYYLAEERQYRKLFQRIATRDGSIPPFSLDASLAGSPSRAWIRAYLSKPLLIFHGVLFLTVTVVMLLLRRHGA